MSRASRPTCPDSFRGIAQLEDPSTTSPQLITRQEEYLASLAAGSESTPDEALAALRTQVALAESPSLSASTPPSALPLNLAASYWLDLRAYDPLATAAGLRLPMFLGQGGRDYQVPPSELAAWQEALKGSGDVTFKVYPAIDHLLLPGSGPSAPAEYAIPSHVAPELVGDVAGWLKAR